MAINSLCISLKIIFFINININNIVSDRVPILKLNNDRFVVLLRFTLFLFAFENEERNRSVSAKEYIVNSDLKEEEVGDRLIDCNAECGGDVVSYHHHVISYHATSLLFI